MARSSKKAADTSKHEEELPIVESYTITPAPGGWVWIVIKTQGDKVVDCQVSKPGWKSTAMAEILHRIKKL